MNRIGVALLVGLLLAAGCGKYGEPVRARPPSPIEVPADEEEERQETP